MTFPSWWEKSRESNNRESRKQERNYAVKNGGKVQAGSGSSHRAKGDVKHGESLTEMKFTAKGSYSLTATTMKKIIGAADQLGREAEMVIDFTSHGIRAVVRFEEL